MYSYYLVSLTQVGLVHIELNFSFYINGNIYLDGYIRGSEECSGKTLVTAAAQVRTQV